MSECPPQAQLQALLADNLTAAQEAVVASHLQGCHTCQAILAEMTAGTATPVPAAPATPILEPRDDFPDRLKAALRAEVLTNCPGPRSRWQQQTEELPMVPGYEVVSELGRGGMGVVYKARHVALNRVVALKMIRVERADPRDLSRLHGEAQSLARLRHANVVQIYEIGEVKGWPFLALEYVEGGTLQQRCGPPQMPTEAAGWLRILAEAVHAAHLQGVIHRDLKPGNVLLASDGTLKVTDFGLARFDQDGANTNTGSFLRTPSYVAPE